MKPIYLSSKIWIAGLLIGFCQSAQGQTVAKPAQDAQLEDLEATRMGYVLQSQAFSPKTRAQALALIDALEMKAGSLSNLEFMIGIGEITALAENGHDEFDSGERAWKPAKRLPIRMIWFPDGMVVARAAPQHADLLGARVLSIEGLSPNELIAKLKILNGGTSTFRTWDAIWTIDSAGVLHALSIAHSPDSLKFRFALVNGHEVHRTIRFIPAADVPAPAYAFRLWSPPPAEGETEHGWRAAVDPTHTPLYLQEPDAPFRIAHISDLDALYIQIRVIVTALNNLTY